MGDRDDQPAQAAPGGRAPLTLDRSAPGAGVVLALIVVVLGALWAAGAVVVLRGETRRHEAQIQRSVEATGRALEDTRRVLAREARLLGEDPAIADGIAARDGAVIARAPVVRVLALSDGRAADVLQLRDAAGLVVVQIPDGLRFGVSRLPPPSVPTTTVRVIDGVPWALGIAPVVSRAATAGVAVVGRRLDRLLPNSNAVRLVALPIDRVGEEAPALLADGWIDAVRAGRVEAGGQRWALRPLAPGDGLWLLLSEREHVGARRRLWSWLLGSFTLALAATLGAARLAHRRPALPQRPPRRPPEGEAGSPSGAPVEPEGRRRLEALTRLTQKLTATLSLDEVFQRVVDAAVELFGSSESRLWLVDAESRQVGLRASSGARQAPGTVRLPLGEGMAGTIATTGRPLTVDDLRADPRVQDPARVRAEGLVAFAGVPLLLGDRVLGALTVALRTSHTYTAQEIGLLQSLANYAAIAIENARLFASQQARRTELAALLEINKKIAATTSTDELLAAIAQEAARLLDVDNAGFRLLERDELVVAGLAGRAVETMKRPRIKVGESLSGRVVAEGRTLVTTLDRPDVIPEHLEADRRLGYTMFLGVPLRVGDRIIGALTFRARRAFSDRDRELAEAFADQAAVALEYSRLYREASRQADRMLRLVDVERTVSETLDPDVVGRRVVATVRTLLTAHAAALYRLEPGTGGLVAIAGTAADDPGLRPLSLLAPGTGLGGLAVRERRPVASPNILTDARLAFAPDARRQLERSVYRSAIAVPLAVHDRVIGALTVADREGRVFDSDEIRVAQAFADQAALALENAQLHADTERRRREAEELARLAGTLTERLEVTAVGRRIVESVVALCGAYSSALRLLEPDGSLALVAVKSVDDHPFELGHRMLPGEGIMGRAVREGRPVWSRDVTSDPSVGYTTPHLERLSRAGHRAVLAVPLRAKGAIIGALVIADRVARDFAEGDVALAQAFADQAALALENARLHEETDQRRREAEVVADVARTINASLDLDTVLQQVVEAARDLCGSDTARIALREPGTDRFAFRYSGGPLTQTYDTIAIEPGKGSGGQVLRTGRPFRTDNYLEDPRITRDFVDIVRAEGHVAELVAPIQIGGRVEGLLYVDNRASRPFTERDEAILARLANHAAIAVQNARLYEGLELRATRLRALARLNQVVSSSLEMDRLLEEITHAAAALMNVPVASFWLVDEMQQTLVVQTFSDPTLGADFPARRLGFDEGGVGWVATHREWLNVGDVFADSRFRALDWWRAHGLQGFLGIPVFLDRQLLAVLALNGRRAIELEPGDHDLLHTLVAQAAVAIRNARLYTETTHRLEQTRALLEVAEILTSTLDPEQLFKRAAIKIAQVCQVDRCTLGRLEGARLLPLMSQFADGRVDREMWDAFMRLQPFSPRGVPAQARAIETRQPVIIEDCTATDQLPREWLETYHPASYMVVPLLRQGQVIGLLALDYAERVTPFEPWQVELATAIAGQLALSLENTRLYAEAQERLHETTTLLAVGRVLSEPAPVDELMRRVAREAGRALGADMVGAYTLDGTGERLVPMAGYHVPAHLLDHFRSHPIALDRVPQLLDAWRAGRAIWSSDTQHDERFDSAWVRALPPHSVLLAPMRVRREGVGGLILVWWQTGRAFPSTEIRLIEGIAAQVGLALENAELARQTQLKLRETETLLSISGTLSSTLDLDALLRQFLRQMAGAIDTDSVGVWMVSEDGEWIEPTVGYHVPLARLEASRTIRLSVRHHEFYAEAVRTRRPMYATDSATDPRVPRFIFESLPHRSQLFVPIFAKDRLVAGFLAVWWERPHEFTQGEIALVEAIASQTGVALENARLFQQNRRQVEELSVLHELSRAVTGQLDRHALLEALRTLTPRVLTADRMVVLLVDEAAEEVEVALQIEDGRIREEPPRRLPRSAGLAGVVLTSLRPLRTDDYAAECARRSVPEPVPDGPRHWIGVPMTAGGTVLGVLTLSRAERGFSDTDERLLVNVADLAALALRSARLFEERTRAFGELAAAQDHLVHTEKLRALGEMASGVAHDFNNLLAAILGRAQLLLRRIEDRQLRQWIQVIERSALDGAQTVRRLQEFARVRRDQPRVAVDLHDVARGALEITQARWREEALRRGVRIEVRTDLGSVERVAGDPVELREALTNLILNAVDAMAGGGTLTLATRRAGDDVELTVTDTGAGIPEEIRAKIFDPFFTTKGPQGTGLGLSMTYGILARHGARIAVESAEGRGTTFRITFPLPERLERETEEAPGPAPVRTRLRCLVIDDEREVGEVLGDVLEAAGHGAVVVQDGAVGIERFRREAFDVVFTDLAMPGTTGWQVADAVRSVAPEVPVFVVTGFGAELSDEERQVHGVAAILSKPLRINDVMDALARVERRAGTAGGENS